MSSIMMMLMVLFIIHIAIQLIDYSPSMASVNQHFPILILYADIFYFRVTISLYELIINFNQM